MQKWICHKPERSGYPEREKWSVWKRDGLMEPAFHLGPKDWGRTRIKHRVGGCLLDRQLLGGVSSNTEILTLQMHAKSTRTVFPLKRKGPQKTVAFIGKKPNSLTSFILTILSSLSPLPLSPFYPSSSISISLSIWILFLNSNSKTWPLD